ncbi:hypothetical protein HR45_13780 [Shewanella mangrovi]|uniref:Glycosyl transferase family 1 domain-containing protein n=1 Tax=Shewanella mangrovi TaxID=1515746 RepID=A0A094JCE2_9GAMM|nr:glycosyltransferase [Shewanella mangrovi]KFZ36867.1 hypothetical protein HR45_13780 [Shewanella mangrovi]
MKKIVHLITKSEVGGAQKWIFNLINAFPEHKHIVITSSPGWLTNHTSFECKFVPGISNFVSISAYIELYKLVKDIDPDCVIISSANAGIYGRVVCRLLSVSCYYVSHGWSCLYQKSAFRFFFIFLEKIFSSLTKKIICVSRVDYDKAIKEIGINENKVVYLPTGVPSTEIKRDTRIRNDSGILNGVFVARLSFPKRIDLLDEIEKFNDLNIEIDVYGDGPLGKKYHSGDKVKYKGEVYNFSDYHKYDFFILLSDSEGLPMSGLEAAVVGLPLILSNVGGCPELLIKNNGVLVQNNSVDELYKALKEFTSNSEIYIENALICKDAFLIDTVIQDYRHVFEL